MDEYKTIEEISLDGKRVLVRLDLNVPIKDGKVRDFTRIVAMLDTLKFIIDNNGKTILMSHLGRPKGEKNPEFSLKPLAEALTEKLGVPVKMAPDCVGEEVENLVNSMKGGDIMLLENLRFYAAETENEKSFVDNLAKLGDVYVNDAFASAHRAHASLYGLPLRFKEQGKEVCAGFLMDRELNIWKQIAEIKGNSVAIVGGAKLKEKVNAIKEFSKIFDRIILGGVAANVFMNAAGYDIGESKCEENGNNYLDEAKEILSSEYKDKIILPSKVILSNSEFQRKNTVNPKDGLEKDRMVADILPSEDDIETIKKAAKIVWFGPMGAYEYGFVDGSNKIVEAINESNGYAVIGGGDLAAVAEGVKAKISTGGGASITYITTGKLVALEALKN